MMSDAAGNKSNGAQDKRVLRVDGLFRLPIRIAGWIYGCVIALFVFSIHFATRNIADNDAYYHIKLSYLYRTHGLIRSFPWMQHTVLTSAFVDQHFLFHEPVAVAN